MWLRWGGGDTLPGWPRAGLLRSKGIGIPRELVPCRESAPSGHCCPCGHRDPSQDIDTPRTLGPPQGIRTTPLQLIHPPRPVHATIPAIPTPSPPSQPPPCPPRARSALASPRAVCRGFAAILGFPPAGIFRSTICPLHLFSQHMRLMHCFSTSFALCFDFHLK